MKKWLVVVKHTIIVEAEDEEEAIIKAGEQQPDDWHIEDAESSVWEDEDSGQTDFCDSCALEFPVHELVHRVDDDGFWCKNCCETNEEVSKW